MSADPGLRFWLHYVDHAGGLAEPATDGTLVVLPPAVAAEFDLPDELVVTADPDIARDDGIVLLATGHPVLIRAADAALTHGDAGIDAIAPPTTPAPDTTALQEHLRDQVAVEHGRIDVTGLPTRIQRPILRVGALVTYTVSAEEAYQERLECWVDAITGLPLADADIARLRHAPRADGPATAAPSALRAAECALDHAHRILDAAAEHRRGTLAAQASDAHRRERTHAHSYYADVLRSLQRRIAAADADRAPLLRARATATGEERTRRLAEIDEKYQARHDIRPFRLHLVLVPGWRIPVDVRRGARCYPLTFDWLAPLGAYATVRCPHCHAASPLSASKTRLGCVTCLPGTALHAAVAPA